MIEFDVKENLNQDDLMVLHPHLYLLLGYVVSFAYTHNLPVKITSLKSDHVKGRVSGTHKSGRAADISVRGWSKLLQEKLCFKLNSKFSDIAAISASDNKPRACIIHDAGSGVHFHIQVKL